jgi:hypothetical protein
LNKRLAVPVAAALSIAAPPAFATVDMQLEAKRLGFAVENCLYCHATPHAVDAMKKKAQAIGMSHGNCLACHGKDIPAKLNARGDWLAAQRARRKAKVADMAWLREYKEPTRAPAPPHGRKPKAP